MNLKDTLIVLVFVIIGMVVSLGGFMLIDNPAEEGKVYEVIASGDSYQNIKLSGENCFLTSTLIDDVIFIDGDGGTVGCAIIGCAEKDSETCMLEAAARKIKEGSVYCRAICFD
jgi:hypothetical protein